MLSQTNNSLRTQSISKGDRLFNFHVIRWTKGRNVERLILQVSIMEININEFVRYSSVIYFINIIVLSRAYMTSTNNIEYILNTFSIVCVCVLLNMLFLLL